MDAIQPWLTPALLIALFTWLRRDMRDLRNRIDAQGEQLRNRIDAQGEQLRNRIDAQGEQLRNRIDAQGRELGERVGQLRERMARLEGLLEGLREAVTGKRAA